MRMDTPVANGDPTLAALIPHEGVTLAHIIALFQDAHPVTDHLPIVFDRRAHAVLRPCSQIHH
jgi:hypothetical protein